MMDELCRDCVLFVYYLCTIDVLLMYYLCTICVLLYDDKNLKKSSSLIQTTIPLIQKRGNKPLFFIFHNTVPDRRKIEGPKGH